MTRILLLGSNGQVGWNLKRSLLPLGEVIALARDKADFSRPESLRSIVKESKADIIVNAVAYTTVDQAEIEETVANAVNAVSPAVLAEEAKRLNALLIHYSTDYVFDGKKTSPYVEEDIPNPINIYGQTKLSGELNIQTTGCRHFIFRTSWVYAPRGKNFVKTVLRLANECDEIQIVSDQIGAPTSARYIADVTSTVISKLDPAAMFSSIPASGIYHLTPLGSTSWYEFAQFVLESRSTLGMKNISLPKLIPVSTEQYVTRAKRPRNSLLNCSKLEKDWRIARPHWKTLTLLCLEDLEAMLNGN
jgi:dTDP-4-dehydrorhamnose reductase